MKEEALKLADILEGAEVPNDTQMFEASAMIRRLVEELDKQKYQNELLENSIKFAMLANNLQDKQGEPVAWMAEHFDGRKRIEIAGNVYDQDVGWGHKRIPLYTTPQTKPCNGFCGEQECKDNQKNCERARMARKLLGSGTPQTKPLSDEKIWEWFEKNTALTKESALMIARAIEKEHGIK